MNFNENTRLKCIQENAGAVKGRIYGLGEVSFEDKAVYVKGNWYSYSDDNAVWFKLEDYFEVIEGEDKMEEKRMTYAEFEQERLNKRLIKLGVEYIKEYGVYSYNLDKEEAEGKTFDEWLRKSLRNSSNTSAFSKDEIIEILTETYRPIYDKYVAELAEEKANELKVCEDEDLPL